MRTSFDAVSVQAWFAQDEAHVRPGDSASLALAVENVEDRTETYTIIPAGLTAGWTTVTRPNITLFGGSRDVVEVVVRPPAIHSTSAGPTALAVRVIPQSRPDEAVIAETIVGVGAFDDRRITMLQPVQRARRRATFEFMVENHGNNLASCRLHLVDATNRVDGSFDPPAVGVAPGSSSLVRLKLRARRSFFRRAERQLDFEVEAAEPEHDPAAGRATLIQPPTIPIRAAAQALSLAGLVLAVIAAWFGVIKPELRDAAEDAVDDRLGETQVTTTTVASVATASTTTVATSPTPADTTDGDPVSYRISVEAGVTAEASQSMAVPPDSRFLMTDLVLQNPNGDLGRAQLLRNGETLYEWVLDEMTSANQFEPRISPLPFEASDNIVLAVRCDAAGDPTGTGCSIAVLMSGLLVPAQPAAGA